jgi:DNA-binding LytR/AlgR family response regulator
MGGMKRTETWKRVPVRRADGKFLFFDPGEIFYVQVDGHDMLVRTARKTPYRSTRRLREAESNLPAPPFFRCHEAYIVNLARVRTLERRSDSDYRLRLDPPVNKLIPLSRRRLAAFRRLMGAP